MNRTEFIIATAVILFAAFCMGWFANWLAHRLSRVRQSDVADLDRMSQELHEAEETREDIGLGLRRRIRGTGVLKAARGGALRA